MRFAPGEPVMRRHWRGGRITLMQLTRVAADDTQGLRLWMPAGYPYWRVAEDNAHRGEHLDRVGPVQMIRLVSAGADTMIWLPPGGEPYSVWWFWRDGTFEGWCVSLEEPAVRWADMGAAGVDTADHALDLWVSPTLQWHWRDEEEFRARTGHPMYWSATKAQRIRATGQRMIELAARGEFPFDGTWCGYRSDAAWTVPALPAGADRPRATGSGPAEDAGISKIPGRFGG